MNTLASISIGISPYIINTGGFVLSWHGFMTFVAVALAVFLVARWGSRAGLDTDSIYSVAVWAIIGGIVGARLLHVIDFWDDFYQYNPISALYIWNGGIAIFGAVLGGFVGGSLYIMIRNAAWFLSFWGKYLRFLGEAKKAPLPSIGRLADITAPALLIGMAVGRIGDIINGEHCARATNLPWGVIYTHPETIRLAPCAATVQHPAVAYEMLYDLALLGIIWPLRNKLKPDGMLFALFLALYSAGRFFVSFLRVEFNSYLFGLNQAQLIALAVILVTVPLLIYKAQFVRAVARPATPQQAAR